MKFVGRISGIVTYDDDTHDQFAAHRDDQGNVSVNSGYGNSPNESNQAVLELQADTTWLADTFALVSNTLSISGVGSTSKNVNGATIHFSGRVSRDDNTWEDFAVQYDVKAGGQFILNSSGTGSTIGAYAEFVQSVLEELLGGLVGSSNVTAP